VRTLVGLRIAAEELKPQEITIATQISPDSSFLKGEKKGKAVFKFGIWTLDSKLDQEDTELETHINALIDILEPHSDYFKGLSQIAKVEFFCTIIDDDAVVLSTATIARMASLGASIGVTIWNET
jgi:hypothetical protein